MRRFESCRKFREQLVGLDIPSILPGTLLGSGSRLNWESFPVFGEFPGNIQQRLPRQGPYKVLKL